MTSGERSQELRRYLQRNRFMFVFSLTLPSVRNEPLRGSPRWLRRQEGKRMAIDGTAVCAGSWTSTSRHIWSVCSVYSVIPQSRPSPLAGRTQHRAKRALSAGVNRRELPSSIQRGKNGKTSPTKCNFFGFYTFGGSGDRICDLRLACFALICWRKPL